MGIFRAVRRNFLRLGICLLCLVALGYGQNQAACTFHTFSAPFGFLLVLVNGIDVNGNIVGSVLDPQGNEAPFSVWPTDSIPFTRFQTPTLPF